MLDRARLAKQMHEQASSIIVDSSDELSIALSIWHSIARDKELVVRVRAQQYQEGLPLWRDCLDSDLTVNSQIDAYDVVSVDGSQVYPDRHQGPACYMVNIGSIVLSYNQSGASISRNSVPSVYKIAGNEFEASIDQIDCKRSEQELFESLRISKEIKKEGRPQLCLIDGSLIFWHLESKPPELRSRYMVSYLSLLQQFYENDLPVIGYISLAKSKELINVIRFVIKERQSGGDVSAAMSHSPIDFEYTPFTDRIAGSTLEINHLVDADLMAALLTENSRSIIFEHRSKVVDHYPAALKPFFFYLNTGQEIARIELPAWLAHDGKKVDELCSIIMNQVEKGRGYPVVLAEAHEAAVVKAADREFFYYLLSQITFKYNQRYIISQKSLKKRKMNV